MQGVIIDNWTIESSAMDFACKENILSEAGMQFLYALVMWDKVYYMDNHMSSGWKNIWGEKFDQVLCPCEDMTEINAVANQEYNREYWTYEPIIARSALKYILTGSKLGVDYLTFGKRKEFLTEHTPYNIISKIDRTDFLKPLDQAIIELFEDMNKCFGKTVFEIKRPVLIDYIVQNTPEDLDYIDYALMLRNTPLVKKYRKFLDDAEVAFAKGDWKFIKNLCDMSRDIVENEFKKKQKIMSVSCSISPIPPFVKFNLAKDVRKPQKIKVGFLNELCEFAIMNRKF